MIDQKHSNLVFGWSEENVQYVLKIKPSHFNIMRLLGRVDDRGLGLKNQTKHLCLCQDNVVSN